MPSVACSCELAEKSTVVRVVLTGLTLAEVADGVGLVALTRGAVLVCAARFALIALARAGIAQRGLTGQPLLLGHPALRSTLAGVIPAALGARALTAHTALALGVCCAQLAEHTRGVRRAATSSAP